MKIEPPRNLAGSYRVLDDEGRWFATCLEERDAQAIVAAREYQAKLAKAAGE